jgi:LCP family protein required for cell wall assembly
MSGSQRPKKGTPEYEWLYGSNPSLSHPTDPDATQLVSSTAEDSTPAPPPDRTQLLPTTPARPQSPAPAAGDGTAPPTPPPGVSGSPGPGAGSGGRPRGLRLIKILFLAWLIFLIAVPVWAWTKIATVDAEPGGDRPGEQDGTTYLLVGSDSRAGLTTRERRELGTGDAAGQRTDTIMVLHIGSGPNLLLSIPRDSLVEVPGYGVTKINAAYAYGGPKLLVRTIEQSTGIRVDNYVEIGFGGLVKVVDAVGGIEICPKKRMVDPLANLDIRRGCQQADGKTALGYARSRHTSALGDIDRARRQREVVSAVGSKAASPWSVLNPVRYTRLASAGAGSFAIGEDTGPLDLGRFGWAMTRVSGDTGLTCGVPIADLGVNWDEERSARMFQHIIEDDTEGIARSLCTPTGLPK